MGKALSGAKGIRVSSVTNTGFESSFEPKINEIEHHKIVQQTVIRLTMSSMGSLGLLVEACKSCGEESFSEEDGKENCDPNSSTFSTSVSGASIISSVLAPPPTFDILYCKARGMPLDHIGSNAMLQFQNGAYAVHGAELKCTHATCMADGIKFRYCKHCAKAVAKRNFRKRHAHPEFINVKDIPASSFLEPQKPVWYSVHPALSPSRHSTPLLKNRGNKSSSRKQNADCQHPEVHPVVQPMDIDEYNDESDNRQHNQTSYVREVPSAWIELYHNRPDGGDIYTQQEWLQRVMTVAELGSETNKIETNCTDEETSKFMNASNSVVAVKEEFSNNFPPRFVTCADEGNAQEEGMPRYRQHAESLSLQINTDLDLLGTHSIMLDSNGSIVISCTPKT